MSGIKTGCHDGWSDSYRSSLFLCTEGVKFLYPDKLKLSDMNELDMYKGFVDSLFFALPFCGEQDVSWQRVVPSFL